MLATRGEDFYLWARLQKFLRQLGARLQHMFAIVEDDQQLPVSDVLSERLDHRPSRSVSDAEHEGHDLGHEASVRHMRQFHEPYAVGITFEHIGSDLQRQTRLADAARTDQRHQARARQQLLDVRKFLLASDERGHLLREIVRCRFERPQRGKMLLQSRMHDLVEALGAREIAQPHGAQVAQRNALWQTIADKHSHGLRQKHLSPVRDAHDPRCAVDSATEEIVVAALVYTYMQPATNAKGDNVGRILISER